jgi:hypothetical protein
MRKLELERAQRGTGSRTIAPPMRRTFLMLTAMLALGCAKPRGKLPASLSSPHRSDTARKVPPAEPVEATPDQGSMETSTGEQWGEPWSESEDEAEPLGSECEAHQARVAAQIDASGSCETDDDCVEIHLQCFAPCKEAVRADARVTILAAATAYYDACGLGCGKAKCAKLGPRGPLCEDGRCTMDR